MSARDKDTIIVLRKMVKIAREALRKIECHGRNEVGIAIMALEDMEQVELGLERRLEPLP